MIYLKPITAIFCLAAIFHQNASCAYALKEDNLSVIASYKNQNKKVMGTPSIQMMTDCIMELDFSQAIVKPEDVNMQGKYILPLMKIDFSNGKIKSSASYSSLRVKMPLRQYICSGLKETSSFPKVAARAEYTISKEGNVRLYIGGDDVPDEFGGTEDLESFSLVVTLSFTDDTHAVANGDLRVEDDYRAAIDQIKIKIIKKRAGSGKKKKT